MIPKSDAAAQSIPQGLAAGPQLRHQSVPSIRVRRVFGKSHLAGLALSEALEWQKDVIKIHAILGSKNPHPQTFLVGGMAIPIDPDSQNALNADKLMEIKRLLIKAKEFVEKVYIPDLLAVASFYKEWAAIGGGVGISRRTHSEKSSMPGGGVEPDCAIARFEIVLTAASALVPGWKYTRMRLTPVSERDSMWSMPLPRVKKRSKGSVMFVSISSGGIPE